MVVVLLIPVLDVEASSLPGVAPCGPRGARFRTTDDLVHAPALGIRPDDPPSLACLRTALCHHPSSAPPKLRTRMHGMERSARARARIGAAALLLDSPGLTPRPATPVDPWPRPHRPVPRPQTLLCCLVLARCLGLSQADSPLWACKGGWPACNPPSQRRSAALVRFAEAACASGEYLESK